MMINADPHVSRTFAAEQPGLGTPGRLLDWQQLTALPAFKEFYRLIRRLFGMNIALISPDAGRASQLGPGREANPFCLAIQRRRGGLARCRACDAEHALLANRTRQPLRYTCHAGLTEFIIPVVIETDVIALIQCGQVIDRAPTRADWQQARARLAWVDDGTRDLALAFRHTKVMSSATQEDLISLLKLIAHNAATAHARHLLLQQSSQDRLVSQTLAHLQQHFCDTVTLHRVSTAVGASRRNLTRLLRLHTGATLVEHVHRFRIAHACERLERSEDKIADIALACGFGSIQQFNRVFRSRKGQTPAEWRRQLRPPA
jgi:AraC-like DNA-binding protein